tara:strand:- start:3066 stop:3212 length:147 start_codon:yes stop_codon:yes gene_type:complete
MTRIEFVKDEMKMPEEFYDWLDECPVQWFRIGVEDDCIDYSFTIPDTK